jgi:PIN domain nuclease of toxin-antitoxin system
LVLGHRRLGAKTRRLLEAPTSVRWLSPVSIWETALLVEKGRLTLSMPATQWLRTALERSGVADAATNRQVALRFAEHRLDHLDPADRLLTATALAHELELVTADPQLLELDWLPTVEV